VLVHNRAHYHGKNQFQLTQSTPHTSRATSTFSCCLFIWPFINYYRLIRVLVVNENTFSNRPHHLVLIKCVEALGGKMATANVQEIYCHVLYTIHNTNCAQIAEVWVTWHSARFRICEYSASMWDARYRSRIKLSYNDTTKQQF